MSQRHSQKPEAKSQFAIWLQENAALIEASGIPAIIIKSEDHWHYFLDHGTLFRFDDDPTEFKTENLSPLQRAALMRLLMTRPSMLESQVGRSLVMHLVHDVETAYRDKKVEKS